MSAATPPQLVLSLANKADFVRTSIAAEKLPSPPQIAAFLRALVLEIEGILSRRPSADVVPAVHAGLSSLGWDTAANGPTAGSAPPQPAALLSFLDAATDALLPTLTVARAEVERTNKTLTQAEDELLHIEEEASEGSISSKLEKQAVSLRGQLPGLKAAVERAASLARLTEARAKPEDLLAEVKLKEEEATRVAQVTAAVSTQFSGGRAQGPPRPGGSKGSGPPRGSARGERQPQGAAKAPTAAAAQSTGDDDAVDHTTDITLVDASALRKGGYVLINEVPCRIGELTTTKTGKHGHCKVGITATEVASGKKVERHFPSSQKMTVPGKRWLATLAPP